MLVKACKSNSIAQIIVFILLALALMIPDVFNSQIRFETAGGHLDHILSQFYQNSPRLSAGAGFLLWIVLVFLMAAQLNKHGLSKNPLAMPIFCLLIPALNPGIPALSPMLIVALLLVLACGNLFRMYDKREAYVHVLNAAFYLGLIPLIAPSWIWLCAILPLCFLIYPVYHWREWLIGIGTMTLILGAATVFYYYGKREPLYEYPNLNLNWDWMSVIPHLFWIIGLILAWAFVIRKGLELDIAQRKKVYLIAYMLCVTIVPVMFFGSGDPLLIWMLAGFFFSEYIFRHPIRLCREIFMYAFIVLLFLYRYALTYLQEYLLTVFGDFKNF